MDGQSTKGMNEHVIDSTFSRQRASFLWFWFEEDMKEARNVKPLIWLMDSQWLLVGSLLNLIVSPE